MEQCSPFVIIGSLAVSYQLPVAGYQLPVAGYQLPVITLYFQWFNFCDNYTLTATS